MSKPLLSLLATACALAQPALAHSRPVTLTAQLKSYGGDGAYLAAYLTDAAIPLHAYTGLITLSGHFQGGVYFSAQRSMILELLHQMQEPDCGEHNLLCEYVSS